MLLLQGVHAVTQCLLLINVYFFVDRMFFTKQNENFTKILRQDYYVNYYSNDFCDYNILCQQLDFQFLNFCISENKLYIWLKLV